MTGPVSIPLPRADDGEPRSDGPATATPTLVPVRLIGLPLDVAFRSTEYHDGLVRELTLLTLEDEQGRVLPTGLRRLIDGLRGRLAGFTAGPNDVVARAVAAGARSLDIQLSVPADIADDLASLDRLLDQADGYCRAGEHLLTLAAPPEVTGYRRWVIRQLTTQVRGGAAEPWGPS